VVLTVGFAFDANAGLKPDAPAWMQRGGLTWLYRLVSEPRRLGLRYAKWNSLFLYYLLRDGWRRQAWGELTGNANPP
jgi:N-acetylglucosaminyldiphosphoundecaprenol N-acetyl-beta-D-mannosaminyltransferase